MTTVGHDALRRFFAQQNSWAKTAVPVERRVEQAQKMSRILKELESVPGLVYSTTDDFDDLFMMPIGQLLLSLSGDFWMRGANPGDKLARGWWRLLPGRPPDATTPLVFDDTIARSKMYGPLAYGLVLVIGGSVGEVIRRWG